MKGTKHGGEINPRGTDNLQTASLHRPFIQSIHFLQESSPMLINTSWCGLYGQVLQPYTWSSAVLLLVPGHLTPAWLGHWHRVHFVSCDLGHPMCPLECPPPPHRIPPAHSLPVHYTAFSAGCATVRALHYVFSYFAWDLCNPLFIYLLF